MSLRAFAGGSLGWRVAGPGDQVALSLARHWYRRLGRVHWLFEGSQQTAPARIMHMRFKTRAGGKRQCLFLSKGESRIDVGRQNPAVFHQHLAIGPQTYPRSQNLAYTRRAWLI